MSDDFEFEDVKEVDSEELEDDEEYIDDEEEEEEERKASSCPFKKIFPGLNINKKDIDKWAGKKPLVLIDFSSLEGTLSTLAKIIAVMAIFKFLFKHED